MSNPNKKPPRRQLPGTCELVVWGIPKDVKNAFKAACIRKGRTMQGVVVALLKGYVNRTNENET